ncbi:MAG: glycosyltransferase [Anaerolineales bacterium]
MSTLPKVLVISELFPNPARPAFGIFVERQTTYLKPYAQQVVVVPNRIFPHLRLWKHLLQPRKMATEWQQWRAEITQIPAQTELNGLPVYYPRYTSLPKQIFHSLWGYFSYAASRNLLKQLHQQHHFDLIHAHYAAGAGVMATLAQRWMQTPIVLSIHGSDLAYTIHQKPFGAYIIPRILKNADAVLANSVSTANGLLQAGVASERLHIVRLGANPPPDYARASVQNSTAERPLQILAVGYLHLTKGHAYLLQALAQLKQQGYAFHCTLVGDGPEEQRLKQFVQESGMTQQVTFAGYMPHADVWQYFANCDIFALPSWNEAFGVVYIEALSLGKPVIGCQGAGGPEDLRALGDCIELVAPRDVASLRAALQRLFDDPQRRLQMGETGKQIVQQYYTWENTARHTAQIYDQILRKHSRV